jgi:hypothetical protein
MDLDADGLREEIHSIFHPEPIVGSEGEEWHERLPDQRLRKEHSLDASYWREFEYGSTSALMRRAAEHDDELAAIVRAQQVPRELFMGTLRLFGDSLLAYHGQSERSGPYRFYPGILVSAWASFEAFVRIYSELFVKSARELPEPVADALLEKTMGLDEQGKVQTKFSPRPLLHRYWWLLKFGYGCEYDRGSRIWQLGKAAIDKRNELVHYKFSEMPSLKTTDLWQHIEAIFLLLIGPSCQIRKTVFPDLYGLYGTLMDLRPLIEEFEEAPFLKGFALDLESVIFPCPFDNVNETNFPTFSRYLDRKTLR